MNGIINAAFSRSKFVAFLFVILLAVGANSYSSIPKESTPEVSIPVIYVSTSISGISPGDAERLLVVPLETELGAVTGVKKIIATASQGRASIQLEFKAGFDAQAALDKVRQAVDKVIPKLPQDAKTPVITEINTALFPVVTAILSGNIPERSLVALAEDLKSQIENIADVLEVDVAGDRSEIVEVIVDPLVLNTYNIPLESVVGKINRNNRLIAAGAIENAEGRMVLTVPGLVENLDDVMSLPVSVNGNAVVTLSDISTIRRTFQDPSGFARIDGQPALSLEIKKRSGANIIETVKSVRDVITQAEALLPPGVNITVQQDQSKQVKATLADLESNVLAAIALVMIVIIWSLGVRSSILVGLAIPGAFLTGVAALFFMGYTMNIVVLFGLILVVGMLVDGAIVTVELADRMLDEGQTPRDAYANAAKRMSLPIIASTMTTLCVFFPLLFWAGLVGQFMKYLPLTVILTLSASLFMALIFIPVLGGVIGRAQPRSSVTKAQIYAADVGDPRQMTGFAGRYVRLLEWSILRPWRTISFAVIALFASFLIYGSLGNGVSFFPATEPDFAQVEIRAKDNLSIFEKDSLVRRIEDQMIGRDHIASIYARTGAGQRADEDVIGALTVEFTPWDTRPPAELLIEVLRADLAGIPGVEIEIQVEQSGPAGGKPVVLEVISNNDADRAAAVAAIKATMISQDAFTDIGDTSPLPGVEWSVMVDRSSAARFGADVALLGQTIQLLTRGVVVAEYRPDDAEDPIDIRVRLAADHRSIDGLRSLRVTTNAGSVPISNFVTIEPTPKSGTITRVDQQRVTTISADVRPDKQVSAEIEKLKGTLATLDSPQTVSLSFGGEAADQAEAMIFLGGAFATAILMMLLILVLQFNSFYQAFIVMSAIVFSISGVLLGLVITGRPFGIVMCGIGIIALAGIVVNNNIVLIDTFNDLRKNGASVLEAALRAGAQRLRPIVLTSLTTVLGLIPMVIGLSINFFDRSITYGAPSTQWWTEMSSAIAGGLLFATILTLIVTPAMLVLSTRKSERHIETQNGRR
jgi:multidrug efflux pump